MGRKNRIKKNKKKKESDVTTGNINGGSNNNNNNHNNNISIPTLDDETVVETMTMVLTPNQIDEIDRKYQLVGYPKSNYFVVGYRARKANKDDSAADAFKRGATEVSCVPSMVGYAELQRERGNVHLSVPFYIEAAIRGHTGSMGRLTGLYEQSKPKIARALVSLWTKMKIEFGDSTYTKESWKVLKKKESNVCFVCSKTDLTDNDVTLVQCRICKYYSYCGKKCQTYHWQEGKHMNECRQVILLRKYGKPQYVKEIREAIIGGQDPKEIHTLQQLRTKLGLNRPKEDYEELLLCLSDDNNNNNNPRHSNSNRIRPNPFEYLVARKDGTVHIGSTPSVMNIQVPHSVQQIGESGLTEAGLRSINIPENIHPIGVGAVTLIARMDPEPIQANGFVLVPNSNIQVNYNGAADGTDNGGGGRPFPTITTTPSTHTLLTSTATKMSHRGNLKTEGLPDGTGSDAMVPYANGTTTVDTTIDSLLASLVSGITSDSAAAPAVARAGARTLASNTDSSSMRARGPTAPGQEMLVPVAAATAICAREVGAVTVRSAVEDSWMTSMIADRRAATIGKPKPVCIERKEKKR